MIPPIALSSVDLPDPFAPTRPIVSPWAMSTDTSRSAQKSSLPRDPRPIDSRRSLTDFSFCSMKRFDTPSTWIALVVIGHR